MYWSTIKRSASKLNIFWPKFQSILSVLQPLLQSNWKWLPYRTKLPLLHSSTRKHTIKPPLYNFYTLVVTKRSLWMHSHSPGRSVLSVTSLAFLLRSPLRSNVLNLLTVPHTYLKTEGAFQGGPSTLSVPKKTKYLQTNITTAYVSFPLVYVHCLHCLNVYVV